MKKLPKGLSVVKDGERTLAQLYNTLILKRSGNEITLNTGGWFTMHTKKCMNLVLADFGYYVKQVKGVWSVRTRDGKHVATFNSNSITLKRYIS